MPRCGWRLALEWGGLMRVELVSRLGRWERGAGNIKSSISYDIVPVNEETHLGLFSN